MKAVSHMLVGTTLYVGFVVLTGRPLSISAMAVSTLASLLPDIDHPKSAFGRVVPFISIPLSALVGHRGVTHSLLAVVGMFLFCAVNFESSNMAIALTIGYLSHLLADFLTNSGIPALWPKKQRYVLPVFKTGSFLEYLVTIALCVALPCIILSNASAIDW